MEYTDLSPEEQLLLVGLLEMVSAADQVLSDEEQAYLQEVATKLGQEHFDAMVNAARLRLKTPEDLKSCALSIQRTEAKELILSALQDMAVSDEVAVEEMQIVNWLADCGTSKISVQRFGEESAGALTLLPEGEPFPEPGSYRPLPTDELRALLSGLPAVPPLVAGGLARMSLAGAQHKLGLHRRDETFLLPLHAASSLVIKPDNARGDLFPFCPANEHFCMTLARRVGLPAPRTELIHLPEPIFVVERFDRLVDAGQVRRLHQIDLCQLLNKWAGYKYESEGGITFAESFRAMDETRQPAVSRNQLLRWLIFNYVIGNSDAHAKTVAFLLSGDGLTLAPTYDLLCVATYGPDFDYMAMTLAEEVRYGDPSLDGVVEVIDRHAGYLRSSN